MNRKMLKPTVLLLLTLTPLQSPAQAHLLTYRVELNPLKSTVRQATKDLEAALRRLIDYAFEKGDVLLQNLSVEVQKLLNQAITDLDRLLDKQIDNITDNAQRTLAQTLVQATDNINRFLDEAATLKNSTATDLQTTLNSTLLTPLGDSYFLQNVRGTDVPDDGRNTFPLILIGTYLGYGDSTHKSNIHVYLNDAEIEHAKGSRALEKNVYQLELPRSLIKKATGNPGEQILTLRIKVEFTVKGKPSRTTLNQQVVLRITGGEAGKVTFQVPDRPEFNWVDQGWVQNQITTTLPADNKSQTFTVELPRVTGKQNPPTDGTSYYESHQYTCTHETLGPKALDWHAKLISPHFTHEDYQFGPQGPNPCTNYWVSPRFSGPPTLKFESRAAETLKDPTGYRLHITTNAWTQTYTVRAHLWRYQRTRAATEPQTLTFRFREPLIFKVPDWNEPFVLTFNFNDGRTIKLDSASGGNAQLGLSLKSTSQDGWRYYTLVYNPR